MSKQGGKPPVQDFAQTVWHYCKIFHVDMTPAINTVTDLVSGLITLRLANMHLDNTVKEMEAINKETRELVHRANPYYKPRANEPP
ncbi:hypothetical protein N9112_00205 [bacterium]|nr:hypothetical protein [bacterium]